MRAEGSVTSGSTETEQRALRGHFDGGIDYDINGNWRSGAKVSVASDDTYLGRYRFSDDRMLTSNVFLEGFFGRNYAAGNLYRFQGLRPTDDSKTIPLVMPEVDFSLLSARDRLGGRLGVEGNVRSLVRSVGTDSVRMSLDTGWQLPYTSPRGQRLNLFARLQTDGYWIDRPAERSADITGRAFPQAGLDWRFPLVRHRDGFSQIVEPIMGFVVAPRGGNSDRIPNEDSLDLELDDTNVFDRSRATGLDLVENGKRMYYGLQGQAARSWPHGGERVSGAELPFRRQRPVSVRLRAGRGPFGHRRPASMSNTANICGFFTGSATITRSCGRDGTRSAPLSAPTPSRFLPITSSSTTSRRRWGSEDRREINLRLDAKITDSVALRGETQRDIQDGRYLWHRGEIAYREDCYDVSFSFERTPDPGPRHPAHEHLPPAGQPDGTAGELGPVRFIWKRSAGSDRRASLDSDCGSI